MSALESLTIRIMDTPGSVAERQLVLVARALVQQKKIFILDEPTANMDFGN